MSNKVPEQGLPDYDFETASEQERWAFDQGFERGWQEHGIEEIKGMSPAELIAYAGKLTHHLDEALQALEIRIKL